MNKTDLVLGWADDGRTRSDMVGAGAISLTPACLTEKFDLFGQSGGGKTYTAMKLAELMLEIGGWIVVLDPAGVWKGLRQGAQPGRRGYPVVLMGGEGGDVPLNAHSGRLVAETIVRHRISAVLDVSELLEDELSLFVYEFVSHFFHLKKTTDKSPCHFFLEECQEFIPEDLPTKGSHRMRAACVRMMKIGRNYGIGWTAITQEPQAASKRALNQAGTIVAVRTIGGNERKAISETARSRARTKEQLSLVDLLPDLETGQAMVWSPSYLKHAGVIRVAPRVTYDSSRTPTAGERPVPAGERERVDLDKLRVSMASLLEEQKAADPTALQERVRELEAQLAAPQRASPAEEVVREVPVFDEWDKETLAGCISRARSLGEEAEALGAVITTLLSVVSEREREAAHNQDTIVSKVGAAAMTGAGMPLARLPSTNLAADLRPVTVQLDALKERDADYVRHLLGTLANHHPMAVSRGQLAVLSGRSTRSSAFDTAMAQIKRYALTELTNGGMVLSGKGWGFIGRAPKAGRNDPAELRETWKRALPDYERVLFEVLLKSYPRAMTREQLAIESKKSIKSSAFDTAVAALKKNLLVEVTGAGGLMATKMLFQRGAA